MRRRAWRRAAVSSEVPWVSLRTSLLVSGAEGVPPGLRLTLTAERSVVLDLDGRERAGMALPVEGWVVEVLEEVVCVARRELSWEVKASEPERGISFFCFFGGGCP